jgi:hypothetical protein
MKAGDHAAEAGTRGPGRPPTGPTCCGSAKESASACASRSVPAILDGGMRVRNEDDLDRLLRRRALGDATMWVLVPLLLSLGGGFLVFIGIFAGEPEWDVLAGFGAIICGVSIAGLIGARGVIVALVLTAVGAFGGGSGSSSATELRSAPSPMSATGTTDRTMWATCTTTRSGQPPSLASSRRLVQKEMSLALST